MKLGLAFSYNNKGKCNFFTKSRLRLWGKSILTILSIGFLLAVLLREKELHFWVHRHAYLKAFACGFAIYPISLWVQALTWNLIIKRLESTTNGWHNVEIYAYTYLMRHLPGAIWYLAGRTVAYQEQGIRARIVLSASGIEWTLLIVAAGLVYSGARYNLGLLLIIPLLYIPWLISKIGFVRRVEGRKWLPTSIGQWVKIFSQIVVLPFKDVFFWSGLYAICYIIGGIILFLVIREIVPIAATHITLADTIGIWALTTGIGFLSSTIIPLGMGIRELTLTTMLYPDLPIAEGAMVALFVRILFLISDLVWAGLIWATTRYIRRHRSC